MIDPTTIKEMPANFKFYEELGKESKAYYDGYPYPFFHFSTWLSENDGPLPKCLPIVKNIVNKGARWLFGKGVELKSSDDKLEDEINKVWEFNKMPSRLPHLAKLGSIDGGVVLKFSLVENKVRVNILSAINEVKFYYDPHDKFKVILARVEYPYMDYTDGKWYWYREDWTDDEWVVYHSVMLNVFNRASKNPYYYTSTPYAPNREVYNWAVKSRQKNKFGVIPLMYIRNLENDSEYGDGDIFHLTRTVDRINLVYHLMDVSNQRDTDPTKVFFDVEAEQDELGHTTEAGGVMSLQSAEATDGSAKAGRVELLEAKGLMRAPMELYAKDMKAMLYEATGMVFTRPEDITNKGNLTQSVLVQLYAPLIEITNEKRKLYGDEGIVRFMHLMCKGLKNYGFGNFKLYNEDTTEFTCKWPDYFRMSADEKLSEVDRLSIEVKEGLNTRTEVLKKIGTLEEIEDIDALVKELADWTDPMLELEKQKIENPAEPAGKSGEKDNDTTNRRSQKRGNRVRDTA